MPRFHHANLGVPPGVEDAEGAFLINVLGYRKLDPPPELVGIVRWFQADDGSEIHLSVDPEHRPAARAHTAIEVDDEIEARLEAAGIAYRHSRGFADVAVTFCTDPAGNLWELRRRRSP
ncbi:MAG: glyoxalase [Frankia sp.]|nr:glyoxalase [Frankia sp.]